MTTTCRKVGEQTVGIQKKPFHRQAEKTGNNLTQQGIISQYCMQLKDHDGIVYWCQTPLILLCLHKVVSRYPVFKLCSREDRLQPHSRPDGRKGLRGPLLGRGTGVPDDRLNKVRQHRDSRDKGKTVSLQEESDVSEGGIEPSTEKVGVFTP